MQCLPEGFPFYGMLAGECVQYFGPVHVKRLSEGNEGDDRSHESNEGDEGHDNSESKRHFGNLLDMI